jgi:transposase InsO family protein
VIESDNRPELVCDRVQDWISKRGIATKLIEPGSPWQNGHNESFNGVLIGRSGSERAYSSTSQVASDRKLIGIRGVR